MGWGIEVVRPGLRKIFREAKRKYRITHPQQAHEGVVIEYTAKDAEDDIDNRFKQRIAELFPDFVYIDFVPVPLAPEVADQQEWDN